MTLAELIEAARQRSGDDMSQNYLCTDEEWTRFANESEREACRRARLIVDSTTASICVIPITLATNLYTIDSRVLRIKRVKLANRTIPLSPVSYRDLDRAIPGWQSDTGEPRAYIKDMDVGKFKLYPAPIDQDTMTLTVIRLPLTDIVTDGPELKEHLHEGLIHGMLERFYSRPDTETIDPQKAAKHAALFEAEFGKKSSALDEAWLEQNAGYMDEEGQF